MAVRVERLARIVLNSADPKTLARFFIDACGFSRRAGVERRSQVLRLGPTRLDIIHAVGRPYPAEVQGWSPLFQHCALVTTDMTRAMAGLHKIHGWTTISTSGPEHLPESSGGVAAFKFRDPEGHPLEFLAFPAAPADDSDELFLRIDHSAISVTSTERSVAFYARLGLRVGARSLNVGPEQARLDAVPNAEVEVTALDLPTGAKPHVELLCYRGTYDRDVGPVQPDDVAATRLVFAVESIEAMNAIRTAHADRLIPTEGAGALLRDPDGHIVEIEVC
ncbi:MAG: glyoxalase [Methylovirgula sp.]